MVLFSKMEFAMNAAFSLFKQPQKLRKHRALLLHGIGKKLICNMCGKEFLSKVNLISHQLYHKEKKKYKCLKCQSSYVEEKNFRNHMKRVHKISDFIIFLLAKRAAT